MERWPPPKGQTGQPVDTSLYDILEVSCTATTEEIRSAFKRVSLKYHPDKGGSTEKFRQAQDAVSVLANSVERKCYDAYGLDYANVSGIVEFKEQYMVPDTHVQLPVTIPELLAGTTKQVQYRRSENGLVTMAVATVEVPKGAINGQRLTLPRLGNVESGKEPGNLIVVMVQHPYPNWGRHGTVLLHKRALQVHEMLGGQFEVDHPDGTRRHVHITSMQPDKWYKIDDFYINCSCVFPSTEGATVPTTDEELQTLIRESVSTVREEDVSGQQQQQCPMQ